MGAEQPVSSPRESAADILRAIPAPSAVLCPKCKYDLRGLPDREGAATCPECGGSFTRAQIAAGPPGFFQRDVSPLWMLPVLGVLMAMLVSASPPVLYGGAGVLFLWPWMLVFAGAARFHAPPMRWSSVGAGCLLCIPILWIGADERCLDFVGVLFVNGIPLAVWAGMWLIPSGKGERPDTPMALLMLALIPGVVGVALVGSGVWGYSQGWLWSAWSDPRSGQIYDQFPLRTDEAIIVGAALLIIAGVLVGVAAAVSRYGRRRAVDRGGHS